MGIIRNSIKSIAKSDNIIKSFTDNLSTFTYVSTVTCKDVGGECKFVADPFIHYDHKEKLWYLLAEVASPARRQHIGTFISYDLQRWQFSGDAIKGSRESFPSITEFNDMYLMTPCVEATPAPGLVPIYRAKKMSGTWELHNIVDLIKPVSDRFLLPTDKLGCYLLVYGSKTPLGPAIESLEIQFIDTNDAVSVGKKKYIARTNVSDYLSQKLFNHPRITMRPGGGPTRHADGFIFPVQATTTGKYGECLAFMYVVEENNSIIIKDLEYLYPKKFHMNWSATHHFSCAASEHTKAYAIDGHSGDGNWEVRIYSKDK